VAADLSVSSCDVRIEDDIATLSVMPASLWEERAGVTPDMYGTLDRWWEVHPDLARAMEQVRNRDDVRVIVLTGAKDGIFCYHNFDLADTALYQARSRQPPHPRGWMYRAVKGLMQHHQIAADCEKPIIARVNGDALGGGLAMALSSDFIVAREDAIMFDYHMGLESWIPGHGPDISRFVEAQAARSTRGVRNAMPPGDGGLAWIPQYMSPARAKEFLMLGRPYTAKDFEQMGIINYAVPADEVDAIVDDLAQRIIRRPPEMIAMTKRVANRGVVQHLNMTLDAGAYAEWLGRPSDGGRAESWNDERYAEGAP